MTSCPYCGHIPSVELFRCELCGGVYRVGGFPDRCNLCSREITHIRCGRCVKPGTIISGGFRPIETLEAGEEIYGSQGRTKVDEVVQHLYEGELVTIKALGLLPFSVTPDHEIFISTVSGKDWNRQVSNTYLKPAKDLEPVFRKSSSSHDLREGDFLIVPRQTGTIDSQELSLRPWINGEARLKRKTWPVNRDTAWLIGLYTADGCVSNKVRLYLGSEEQSTIDEAKRIIEALGFKPNVKPVKGERCVEVQLQSRVLARAFREWCGHSAKGKQIPDFIIDHIDPSIREGFLKGYLAGDGYAGINCWKASTASLKLALQLQLLSTSLGSLPNIYIRAREESILGRRVIKGGPQFLLEFPRRKHDFKIVVEQFILTPLLKITRDPYRGRIFDAKTDQEVILLNNALTHNCGGKWPTHKDIPKLQNTREKELYRKLEMMNDESESHRRRLKQFAIARQVR